MLKVVSTGFLVEEDTALMWRGLMLNKAVEQFLRDVHWGELDYLFIDMPPGTGDVQMGLARLLPRTDLLIVTTPAIAAQKVAARAADMARRSFLRVCGVIENMSSFTCEHGVEYALFGTGGGQVLADEIGVELLGRVPLEPAVAAGGDAGRPVVDRRNRIGSRRVPGDRPQDHRRGCSAGQHGRVLGADVVAGCCGAGRGRSAQCRLNPSRRSRRRRATTTPTHSAVASLRSLAAGSRSAGRVGALTAIADSASAWAPTNSRFLIVGGIIISLAVGLTTQRIAGPHPSAGDRLVVVVLRRLSRAGRPR